MNIRSLLSERIEAAFDSLGLQGDALLQTASRPEFGDYQSNGVMAAAKRGGLNPREVAQQVIDTVTSRVSPKISASPDRASSTSP